MNRSKKNTKSIQALVQQELKRLKINSPPIWKQVPSKIYDPPSYNACPIWQRKFRMQIATKLDNDTDITFQQVITKKYATIFTFMICTRITVYGPADGSTLYLRANMNPEDNLFRCFTDCGVKDSKRSHITIATSPKDWQPVDSSNYSNTFVSLNLIDSRNKRSVGQIIIDFHVRMWEQVDALSSLGTFLFNEEDTDSILSLPM